MKIITKKVTNESLSVLQSEFWTNKNEVIGVGTIFKTNKLHQTN